ncbi:hypothetical protein KAJ83_16245 [Marivibrio halodurans]|uniref:Uncharacterized protein n=1 Tax=Marivibrio halodurans TaxID=2039722 RepID=A0A8J7S1E3_9PROT|nr:hypothetical protein [Marivibrio halodurans]MBP5858572.1 hypothetical protein [Marivibrio halodurans]
MSRLHASTLDMDNGGSRSDRAAETPAAMNVQEAAGLDAVEPDMAGLAPPLDAVNRYLVMVGISLDVVRADLLREVEARLAVMHRSMTRRTREIRALACVERVLCERLGARPGSNTTDPDTASRRLLFSIDPTEEAQRRLLAVGSAEAGASSLGTLSNLMCVPSRGAPRPMPRQRIEFRHPPWHWTPRGIGSRRLKGASAATS